MSHERSAVVASDVATAIEWYGFLVYGVPASLVFPREFTPTQSYTGVVLSFGTYFVGFAARHTR